MPALHWAFGPHDDGLQGSVSEGSAEKVVTDFYRTFRRHEEHPVPWKKSLTLRHRCRVTIAERIASVPLGASAHGHVVEDATPGTYSAGP